MMCNGNSSSERETCGDRGDTGIIGAGDTDIALSAIDGDGERDGELEAGEDCIEDTGVMDIVDLLLRRYLLGFCEYYTSYSL